MYSRDLAKLLKRFQKTFPAIAITGPRQSGKTTLAKHFFSNLPYVSLEALDTRARAISDPRAFLETFKNGAIFDEIQNAPELFPFLQEIIDEKRHEFGKFVLTGSKNFSLLESITQSLAGRIGITTLLPLSMSEISDQSNTNEIIFRGGYPALMEQKIDPLDFFPSYIQTYLERDVRQIKNILDLRKFKQFIKLCAGRVGQLINITNLAQEADISTITAKSWLSALEASYIIFFVHPYHKNFNKRIVKTPKLYFHDTGLVCNLLGIESANQVETHFARGSLFENLAILELMKNRFNEGKDPALYFWRDKAGHEIDIIAEWGDSTNAIEIKSSSTLKSDYLNNLEYFSQLTSDDKTIKLKKFLIYNGQQEGAFLSTNLVPIRTIVETISR